MVAAAAIAAAHRTPAVALITIITGETEIALATTGAEVEVEVEVQGTVITEGHLVKIGTMTGTIQIEAIAAIVVERTLAISVAEEEEIVATMDTGEMAEGAMATG